MKKYFITVLVLVIVAALGFGIWTATKPQAQEDPGGKSGGSGGGGRGGAGGKSGGPPVVSVETVQRQAVPLTLDTVGTVESEHSVEVRPQVGGVLREVLFQEGQNVDQNQLLFRIDPATLESALKQAEANLARDSATSKAAQTQASRLAPLAKKEYVTRDEYSQAQAAAAAAIATEAADRALVDQAKIQLAYGEVRAPIAGRTGSLTVKSGSLVGSGDANPLITINQIRPALVRFSIPQQNLPELRRYDAVSPIKVELYQEDKSGPPLATGELVFIDNNINAESGTVMLKARIANDDEALLPGQFVAVRVILTVEQNTVVIPEAALQAGQDGSFVYLVENGKAQQRPVVTTRQNGSLMVIGSGLQGGEQLITQHPRNLAPDMKVKIAGAASDLASSAAQQADQASTEKSGKRRHKPRGDAAPASSASPQP